MKQIKNLKAPLLVLAIAVVLASGGSVTAHGVDDKTTNSTSTTSSTEVEQKSSNSGRGSITSTTVRQKVAVETETSDDSGLHRKGSALVTELRKERKTQSAEARQKKCQSRKQGLTKKFGRIVTNSQRAQDRISGILDKAVKYQQDNNLTIDTSLITAAQTAQTASADSITALKEVKPSLDCNNVSVVDDVATFKAAAQNTRDKLKAYKSAVKDLLKALEAVKPTTENEGSNQ